MWSMDARIHQNVFICTFLNSTSDGSNQNSSQQDDLQLKELPRVILIYLGLKISGLID